MRTAGELQHSRDGVPRGSTSRQENLRDEGWAGQAGGSVGSEAGLGTLGMQEEDRGQGCRKAEELPVGTPGCSHCYILAALCRFGYRQEAQPR